jgi:Ca-activated chloride channel family protein
MDAAGKERAKRAIAEQLAMGETALYDAIKEGFEQLQKESKKAPDQLAAVVVLTDGEDNKSKTTLEDLLKKVSYNPEGTATRVFTIAYGPEASKEALKRISDATLAESHASDPKNIHKVLRKILEGF